MEREGCPSLEWMFAHSCQSRFLPRRFPHRNLTLHRYISVITFDTRKSTNFFAIIFRIPLVAYGQCKFERIHASPSDSELVKIKKKETCTCKSFWEVQFEVIHHSKTIFLIKLWRNVSSGQNQKRNHLIPRSNCSLLHSTRANCGEVQRTNGGKLLFLRSRGGGCSLSFPFPLSVFCVQWSRARKWYCNTWQKLESK